MRFKRICVGALAFLLLALLVTPVATAAGTITVTVRIEGAEQTYYHRALTLSAGDSALEALLAAQEDSDSLTLTGADSGYISAVNGETAGTFGGWDGWMYRVNGKELSVGMTDYTMADGDSLVLYYGGYPCQLPQMTVEGSRLVFQSIDNQYDENYHVTEVIAPVVGATVTVGEATFVTDDKGQVDIATLEAGAYTVQIAKKDESGAPAVVRLADTTVTLEAETATTTTETAPTTASVATGETGVVTGVCMLGGAALLMLLTLRRREA